MVDLNRPDIVLTENKTALVIDIAFPLNHNLPKTGAEKITNMKTGPWKSKINESLSTHLYTP